MIKNNAKIYLCRPDRTPICELNGKQIDTVDYKRELKDFNVLTLDVDRYIDVDGVLVESNGYDRLKDHMVLYLEDCDFFQLATPTLNNDGDTNEYKSLVAYSDEKGLEDKDLKGLSFNKGTVDSLEMLATNNVDELGYAKEFITFCNDKNHELSLLHLILEYAPGWSVGYVDPAVKTQKYSFETGNTNVYAFLTTTVSNVVECIFDFDTISRKVNVYHKNNIGLNTNIFIGWRNLLNSLSISPKEDTLYNVLTIQGDSDLDIRSVNYGDSKIYNFDYYLNTSYFKQSTIDKIKKWIKYRDDNRNQYIEYAKKEAECQQKIDDLKYRVPNDGCDLDQYETMDLETLQNTLIMYKKMLEVLQLSVDTRDDYERDEMGYFVKWDNPDDLQNRVYKPWKTSSGKVDDQKYLDLLYDATNGYGGYYTYIELNTYIIPNIQTAIDNYQVPDNDKKDYNEEFETNWDLYGLVELEGKRDQFNKELLGVLASYEKPWSDLTDEEKEEIGIIDENYYNSNHELYLKYKNYLGDENTSGSLLFKIKQLKNEIASVEETQNNYISQINNLTKLADLKNTQFGLTDSEYIAIQNIIREGDYTNSNIFVSSLDDSISAYEKRLELYENGVEKISETSQPQFQVTTNLDNLLSIDEYKDLKSGDNEQGWYDDFDVGNFVMIGIREDYAFKLRLLSLSYNPCTKNSNIEVTYTNMVNRLSGRDDFLYLFEEGSGSSKNSISIGTGDSKDSVEYMTSMLNMLLQNKSFGNMIDNSVSSVINNAQFGSLFGDYLKVHSINVGNIIGSDAQFETLFSKYINSEFISTHIILGDIAEFEELTTRLANIGDALIGTSATETGIIINLSADNAKIDAAWIASVVASQISVKDLFAGDITISDEMRILSENGNMIVNGSTMQFLNPDGEVGIQIGYGNNENPSIIIKDGNGATILTSTGITENAIADGLIVNNMISSGTIQKDKLSFPVIEANEQGGIDITQIYDGEGNVWGIQYDSFKESVNTNINDLLEKTDEFADEIESISFTVNKHEQEIAGKISSDTFTTAISTLENDIEKAKVGMDKWLVEVYPKDLFDTEDQDKYTLDVFGSKGMTPLRIETIKDSDLTIGFDYADNYIGYGLTFVHFTEDYSYTGKFLHSKCASIYLNGSFVKSDDDSVTSAEEDNIVLNFKTGWNCIEVVWNDDTTSEGFMFSPAFSALEKCDEINCKYGNITGRSNSILNKTAELIVGLDSITTRVSSTEQKITQSDSKISELTNQYSTLDQSLTGFKTEVAQTYASREELNGTETELNEYIKTVANQMADKFSWLVDSGTSETNFTLTDRTAELITQYINLTGAVTFSGLSSSAKDEITSNINNAVDGIQVGGRNILRNTKSFTAATENGCLNNQHALAPDHNYLNFSTRGGVVKGSTSAAVVGSTLCNYTISFGFNYGDKFTFSFYAKGTADKFNVFFYGAPGYVKAKSIASSQNRKYNNFGDGATLFDLSEDWTRYWVTWELEPETADRSLSVQKYVLIRTDSNTVENATMYVCGCKLEKGNKATDWSPAPEDAEEKINAVQEIADSAYNWVDSNGSSQIALLNMVKTWTDGAISNTTLINGGFIKTRTILADRLAIGDFTNYVTDPTFELGVYKNSGYFSIDSTVYHSGSKSMKMSAGARNWTNFMINDYLHFPIKAGEKIYVEWWGYRDSANLPAGIGTAIVDSNNVPLVSDLKGVAAMPTTDANQTWVKYSYVGTAQQTGYVRIMFKFMNAGTLTGNWYVDDVVVRRMDSGELIVDGAITTNKLATDAIKSKNYAYTSGVYSTAGTYLDLSNGVFRSKKFGIDSSGNAYFAGELSVKDGNIYIGQNGFKLYDKFVYNTTNGTLKINANEVTIEGDSIATQPYVNRQNYLIGSGNYRKDSVIIWEGNGWKFTAYDGYLRIELDSEVTTNLNNWAILPFSTPLTKGTKYTLSMGLRSNIATFGIWLANGVEGEEGATSGKTTDLTGVTTAWKEFKHTWSAGNNWSYLYFLRSNFTSTSYIDIRYMMLEEGSEATPWIPSIVDSDMVMNSINRDLDEQAETLSDSIKSLSDKTENIDEQISDIVETGGAIDKAVEASKTELTTQIKATQSSITSTNTNLNNYKATVENYMRFSATEGLILGLKNQPFSAKLSGSELGFYNASNKLSWFSGTQMHIKEAVIESTLNIGNVLFKKRTNGNISIVWKA